MVAAPSLLGWSRPLELGPLLALTLLLSARGQGGAVAAAAETLSVWGVKFEPPVAIGEGGSHDGGQGFDGKHMVSGSRCTSDGAKSWFSCEDAYGFVPPTGAMLRINASGPTGPTAEMRNMGKQFGDPIDMKFFKCVPKTPSPTTFDHGALSSCTASTQYLCNNYTNFYAEGPNNHFNQSVKAARLSSNGKIVPVAMPSDANQKMIFDGMKEAGVAFTCGSLCTPQGREYQPKTGGFFGCPFRLGGRGITRRPDGAYVQTLITYLLPGTTANPGIGLGNQNGPYATSVVAFESQDGWHWKFLSVVLTPSDAVASDSEEGPNECDIATLADGKTILAVIRIDAGDGFLPGAEGMPAHAHLPYVAARSTDGGRTWKKERMKPSTNDGMQLGCARPRLMSFGKDAPLVLSGGRNLVAVPPPANGEGAFAHEPKMWVNQKGDGVDWTAISISYVHNALIANETLKFSAKVNTTAVESQSYTALMWTGDRSGVLTYDAGRGKPWAQAFSIRFTLEGA